MKYAKESHAVKKFRQKVKERLKVESKVMKKRMLKKISKVIQLKLAKNELDIELEAHKSTDLDRAAQEKLQSLQKRIRRDEKKLSSTTTRYDVKIKPITTGLKHFFSRDEAAPHKKASELGITHVKRSRGRPKKVIQKEDEKPSSP